MGINRQTDNKVNDNSALITEKEAGFIITKLRQATYTGVEFETFYTVVTKLQKLVEKNIK
tara:strand:- start:127 stop:306 length:180 start_codon:yes stop_codon:yes gene_type:complete